MSTLNLVAVFTILPFCLQIHVDAASSSDTTAVPSAAQIEATGIGDISHLLVSGSAGAACAARSAERQSSLRTPAESRDLLHPTPTYFDPHASHVTSGSSSSSSSTACSVVGPSGPSPIQMHLRRRQSSSARQGRPAPPLGVLDTPPQRAQRGKSGDHRSPKALNCDQPVVPSPAFGSEKELDHDAEGVESESTVTTPLPTSSRMSYAEAALRQPSTLQPRYQPAQFALSFARDEGGCAATEEMASTCCVPTPPTCAAATTPGGGSGGVIDRLTQSPETTTTPKTTGSREMMTRPVAGGATVSPFVSPLVTPALLRETGNDTDVYAASNFAALD